MNPYFTTELGKLYCGDDLDILPTLPDCFISAILTDPPYGLKFMGKEWDHGVPGIPFWIEALRVCKPGAHLLAFGGSRTFHRLMVAIEDAGWEIRDTIGWLYGSGFPKSLDVSKAIDKEAGAEGKYGDKKPNVHSRGDHVLHEGWKRPWQDNPDAVDRSGREYNPATLSALQWSGYGTALKPAWEPIVLARKPLDGTVAQNVQKWGCGALNIDGCRIPTEDKLNGGSCIGSESCTEAWDRPWKHDSDKLMETAERARLSVANAERLGRFPANLIHDGSEEVLECFPVTTSGTFTGKRNTDKTRHCFGAFKGTSEENPHFGNTGSAARFFYTAKASRSERGKGNNHPTVKPRALIRYLLKLIESPTGGIVLDMFAGSGTIPLECEYAKREWMAIDKDPASCEIAKNRIETFEWGETEPGQERLFPKQESLL